MAIAKKHLITCNACQNEYQTSEDILSLREGYQYNQFCSYTCLKNYLEDKNDV